MFSVSQLGWINCDRFYSDPNPKVDFVFNHEASKNVNIKLVFHKMKSVLPGRYREGEIVFPNVPTKQDVTVVALKFENGQYYLATKRTTILDEDGPELDYEPVTLAQLKREMERLNSI